MAKGKDGRDAKGKGKDQKKKDDGDEGSLATAKVPGRKGSREKKVIPLTFSVTCVNACPMVHEPHERQCV